MENTPEKNELFHLEENVLDRLHSINKRGSIIRNNQITVIGKGVNMADKSKDIAVCINDDERSGHVGIIGTTRSGKSGLLINISGMDIKKGYNVVIIDPKGDKSLFQHTIQAAAESGRLADFMLLTPIYPDCSIKLDPLSHYYMEEELVDHVISGIKAKEDFYISIASEITQTIVSGLAIKARSMNQEFRISFNDIKDRVSYQDLSKFREEMLMMKDSSLDAAHVCNSIEKIMHSPQDYFSKVTSSLRTMLSALSSGNTGKIIGKTYANEFVNRFEQGKRVILYCNTGSMLARRTAHIIAKVLISMIQSMVGRFLVSGKILSPPLCVHIDEGQNALYSGIDDFFSKAGGAGCWIHFYTQSMANIEKEVGTEAARGIMDNMNTMIFLPLNHPDTAQFVEDSSPDVKKFQPIITPDDCTGRTTLREVEDKLILKANVLALQKRQFYMRSSGTFYKAFTLDYPPTYLDVSYPAISGNDPAQQNGSADGVSID